MKNTIIYLIGFYGVGKYTIAKEIVQQDNIRLVDNHLINNPVLSLIRRDGKSKLPPAVWDYIRRIRGTVFDAIINVCPEDYNFVLTNSLREVPEDRTWYQETETMANARNAVFVPVRLTCSIEENKRRIVMPERSARMKSTNPDAVIDNNINHRLIEITHPNLLELDVSDLPAEEAAEKIIIHAKSCS